MLDLVFYFLIFFFIIITNFFFSCSIVCVCVVVVVDLFFPYIYNVYIYIYIKSPSAETPKPEKPTIALLSEFSDIKKIASGNFGKAFKAYWSETGRTVVLKVNFFFFTFFSSKKFKINVQIFLRCV